MIFTGGSVSQIFLSDLDESLPSFLSASIDSIKTKFADSNHKVYNNQELRDFISINYPPRVLWAYDTLRPYSYKSDLGRFCLLYIKGGWYFDIAIKCLLRPNIAENTDLICFRDEQRHSLTSWAVAGGIIWSRPGNSILLKAVELIVLNCQERW